MKFKIGDKVKFINDIIEGSVTQITTRGNCTVKTKDGFEYKTNEANLIMDFDISDEIKVSDLDVKKKTLSEIKNYQSSRKLIKVKKEFYREIDLHLNTQDQKMYRLDKHELLSFQLKLFRAELDRAVMNNEPKIIFIHGIGDGILRDEIWQIIRREYSELKCFEASYKKYGYGATEIIINN